MHRKGIQVSTLISSALLVVSSSACSRGDKTAASPAAETQRTAIQAANEPVTVSGCLRAGDGVDTYVLTASVANEGTAPATYQLLGVNDMARNQVGNQVEVSGTVRAKQQTEAITAPAAAPKATGTTGTPTVATQTEVNIRQLDVSNVKPLGDRCDK